MKAVIYKKYGPPEVLTLTDIEKPIPKDDEILVKIVATTVTSGDVRLRSSDFPPLFWLPARLLFGLFRPKKKILGHEWSGVIEEIGKNVTQFKVGDRVLGTATLLKAGSYAEYICLPQKWKHGVVALKPKNLSYGEAAALPIGGMTALYLLEKAHYKKGQSLLIYGASGSVGSYAVQIAKHNGLRVVGVCSASNADRVHALGAEKVMDYNKEDFSKSDEKFDIVLDAVGKTKKSKAKNVLKTRGSFVSVKMLTHEKEEHLALLIEWAEKGAIQPSIDKTFTLDEIVQAHQYVDTGRKRGNVVINIIK